MSYATSAALQSAVYQALQADTTLETLIGDAIYDALPAGTMPPLYVSLGPEMVEDASDSTGRGTLHRFEVSIVSSTPAFASAKEVAGAVSDVLHQADLSLSRGRLVFMSFERASAMRSDGAGGRRIDLRFKARVEDL